MESNSTYHVDIESAKEVENIAKGIMEAGIKTKDAYHVACAIIAECDYFLSTDDRLLKYHSDQLAMLDPIDFIKMWEVNDDE